MKGVYNCSSPNPVDNITFMKTLRKAMAMPFGLTAPKWLLTIGAVLIKTETELILKSRWVLPQKLLQKGYPFSFPTLDNAFQNLLKK